MYCMKKRLIIMLIIMIALTAVLSACNSRIQSLKIQAPENVEYKVGDTLDLEGGRLFVTYSDSNEDIKDLDDEGVTVSPMTLAAKGDAVVITVSFGGKSATFTVKVTEAIERVATGIVVNPPAKTEYIVGNTLDLTAGTITVSYNTAPLVQLVSMKASGVVVSPMLLNTVGNNIAITVTYLGLSSDFNVKVNNVPADSKIKSVSIKTAPDKNEYNYGDSINLAGGYLDVFYEEGGSVTVPMTDSRVTVGDTFGADLGPCFYSLFYKGFEVRLFAYIFNPSYVPDWDTISYVAQLAAVAYYNTQVSKEAVTFYIYCRFYYEYRSIVRSGNDGWLDTFNTTRLESDNLDTIYGGSVLMTRIYNDLESFMDYLRDKSAALFDDAQLFEFVFYLSYSQFMYDILGLDEYLNGNFFYDISLVEELYWGLSILQRGEVLQFVQDATDIYLNFTYILYVFSIDGEVMDAYNVLIYLHFCYNQYLWAQEVGYDFDFASEIITTVQILQETIDALSEEKRIIFDGAFGQLYNFLMDFYYENF